MLLRYVVGHFYCRKPFFPPSNTNILRYLYIRPFFSTYVRILRTNMVVDHFPFLGTLHEDYLRELLTTLGDRFTHDDVDELYKEAPIKNGQFDFVEFTRILKHGAKDPDDK